mmetsp:Transcript_30202/g.60542  ORF Transcript_30202/g.60542 Transcript_30202/m.60542 type:complete len:165 (+) Transcript_30202:633-1127(+)
MDATRRKYKLAVNGPSNPLCFTANSIPRALQSTSHTTSLQAWMGSRKPSGCIEPSSLGSILQNTGRLQYSGRKRFLVFWVDMEKERMNKAGIKDSCLQFLFSSLIAFFNWSISSRIISNSMLVISCCFRNIFIHVVLGLSFAILNENVRWLQGYAKEHTVCGNI